MIEKVMHQNEELAVIIRNTFNKEGVNFITHESYPLQLGVLCHKKGKIIKPHIHKNITRTVNTILEVLHVDSGKVEVLFYQNKQIVQKCMLYTGDTIILLSGGHGFKILEDAKIIEVKQGPYLNKAADKMLLLDAEEELQDDD